MPSLRGLFSGAQSVADIISTIKSALVKRTPVEYGVRKTPGVSMARARKEANQKAIDLLNTLTPGQALTDEQRTILAGYTGEGGIGGSEYEYYTPQHVAAGMWDMMALYGADTGNCLEPSAGSGIFHEMKPRGVVMTATEISEVSGRINQALHPEDSVKIAPFEMLARNAPDDTFDSVIGNIPFGASRGGFALYDKDYADETNMGAYFILRTLDKVKPGGMSCLIVPFGMTTGSDYIKLRQRVSRRAEFLGAHRLPSGTFNENGTATAVDIWVLRKHPADVADKILELDEQTAEGLNVLWPEFIQGFWFKREGRRFMHGEEEWLGEGKFRRLTIRNDQITNEQMRQALSVRFESRIDWAGLNSSEPSISRMQEGDKRFMNGQWYRMEAGRMIVDNTVNTLDLDPTVYGVSQYTDIKTLFRTPQGILSLSFDAIRAIARDYPEQIPDQYTRLLQFANRQKPKAMEKAWRGSVIGLQISDLQDLTANLGTDSDNVRNLNIDVKKLVGQELEKYGNPNSGAKVEISGTGNGPWLRYKSAITANGELSELVKGSLDRTTGEAFDLTDHAETVRFLFNDLTLDPVSLADFRRNFRGTLPESDAELLAMLAGHKDIAITDTGELAPFDRATSGNIASRLAMLRLCLVGTEDERLKTNFHAQIAAIKEKRKWTEADHIRFKLNSRWMNRRLVLEFLLDRGYEEFKYVADVQVEDGKMVSDVNYTGNDGVFTGYRYKTVMEKEKDPEGGYTGRTVPVFKAYTPKDPFARQLENYINGTTYSRQYADRMHALEEDFNDWMRQHDELASTVEQYNSAFNAYIPFEHSGASLELKGISGSRVPMSYQNSEVRRVSEDGRGIIAFGTGLGKTTTALALEAYNFETGRCKRTAYVVPKAVLENWYHEAQGFYAPAVLENFLFVGLNELRDESGNIRQVPALDENGNPKLDAKGEPVMRNALALASSEEIKERMNMIPQSNYRAVVLTKEQYAAIPLRDETIEAHASDIVFAQAEAGRVNLNGSKHRDAAKLNSVKAKASDTGTKKQADFPYFEDMGFDSVIVDEGHNYRNSYSAGREAAALAYLPTGAQAKSAKDMAIKNAYLMKKYNGRGPVLLTATPLVNSPIDAFNMLSHVVPMEEWKKMGILTPDDFVKVFGKTANVLVQKLSGAVEEKNGLVGFENLDGLRGIFHRWTTLKTAKDVSAEVKIPDVKEINQVVPMTDLQRDTYEELRTRAQYLSENPPTDANGNPTVLLDKDGQPIERDSIFAIIRDMDRVCTDPDLYYRAITFNFPLAKLDAVTQLRDDLPKASAAEDDEDGDEGTAGNTDITLRTDDDYAILRVPETLEKDVLARLEKFGLALKDVSHPIPPKYAMLIEQLRTGMANGGKQIVFSDEKSQHEKLKRIIAAALPLDADKIGILNATTVAEAGKGKKPKRVKAPKPLGDEPTSEQLETYYQQKQAYDDYQAALNEVSLGGLEQIAADYQEGRYRILICNKKAEVGINLHQGTSDMHHLTLPWTPASIDQRNGRGARVGGTQDSVNAHYYCGQGSFDEFHLDTLKRKRNWITDILTSNESAMDNADANTTAEMQMMLAANPEERERRFREEQERIAAEKRSAAQKRARQNLTQFAKAKHAAAHGNPDEVNAQIARLQQNAIDFQADLEKLRSASGRYQEGVDKAAASLKNQQESDPRSYLVSHYKGQLNNEKASQREHFKEIDDKVKELNDARLSITRRQRMLTRIQKAATTIKQLRPELARAIKDGVLEGLDMDMLDHADECYFAPNGKVYRKGQVWQVPNKPNQYDVYRIRALDIDNGMATVELLWSDDRSKPTGKRIPLPTSQLGTLTSYTEDEVTFMAWLRRRDGIPMAEIMERLSESDFRKYLASGDLLINETQMLVETPKGFDNIKLFESQYQGIGRSTRSMVYGAADAITKNAQYVVWPDGNDDPLKARLAKEFLQKSWLDLAKGFFVLLYGNDYKVSIKNFGDQASPAEVEQIVKETWDKAVSDMSGTIQGFEPDGSGRGQTDAWIVHRSYDQRLTDGVAAYLRRKSWGERTGYSNENDFIRAYETLRVNDVERIRQGMLVAVDELGQEAMRWFEKEEGAMQRAGLEVVRGLTLPRFDLNFLHGKGNDLLAYAELFATAAGVGLIDPATIGPDSFTDGPGLRQRQIQAINDAYAAEMAKPEDQRFTETRIRVGEITAADAAAIVQKAKDDAQAEQDQRAALVQQKTAAITSKENTGVMRCGYGRNKKNFDAGELLCFMDKEGLKGVLCAHKDVLKAQYGALYYKGEPEDECPGSWWVIPKANATLEQIYGILNS